MPQNSAVGKKAAWVKKEMMIYFLIKQSADELDQYLFLG